MNDEIKKTMKKRGVQRSVALRIHAKKDKAAALVSSAVSGLYSSVSDEARKKSTTKKRKRKRKIWIRRDVRRPGKFRRFAEAWGLASKGESIPLGSKSKDATSLQKHTRRLLAKN